MRRNRRAWTWPCLSVPAAWLVACGGQVGGSAPQDGGAPATPFSGYVTATQLSGEPEEILAAFSPSAAPMVLPFLGSCTPDNEVVAGCCYASTTPSRGASSVSAGTVQVNAGGAAQGVSLYPQYGYALQSASLWAPGQVLQVSATGAAVQAFAGSLQTVMPLEGVAPLVAGGPATMIDRAQDFSVQWTPSSVAGDQVMLWFETTSSWIIACTADDAAGTLRVPSDLLQNVAAGDTAIVNFDRFSTTVVSVSNATVTLEGVTGLSAGATFL